MIGTVSQFLKNRKNLNKSKKELEVLQLQKLKKLVHTAYTTVPYYKELFDKHGIRPEDIRSLKDLNKIPITTKKDIKKTPVEKLLSHKYTKKQLTRIYTGGTTGIPLSLYKTKKSLQLAKALKLRKYVMNGYKLYWNIGLFSQNRGPKKKLWHFLHIHREDDISGRISVEQQCEQLLKKNPKLITGLPNRLAVVARHIKHNKLKTIRPKIIVCSSETLLESERKLLREVWGSQPFNSYESRELPNIAMECSKHSGLHVIMDAVIVQIEGQGTTGKAIITDLTNDAMPLLRYELGDSITLSDKKCSCGLDTQMISKVEGRTNEYFITPSGKKICGENAEAGALSDNMNIEQFQVVQQKNGGLLLKIITKNKKLIDEKAIKKSIQEKYEHVPISFKYVKKITPLPSGKRQAFTTEYHEHSKK